MMPTLDLMHASPQDLSDANLIEAIREHARWQEPCDLLEDDGLILVAGPNAFAAAYRNCVVRVDARVSAEDVLERARRFFRPRRRGFTVITRDSRDADLSSFLPTVGLEPAGDSPCMLIESPLAEPTIPADVHVERFSTERHVTDFVQINAEAYETNKLPPHQTRLYFGIPQALLSPRVGGYVAYRGTQPESTALTLFSGASAGVYWVGTAVTAQRQGLAELCTCLATNAGFARGAAVVTLQASPYGEPLYQRLGYRTYDRMRRYIESPAQ